MREIDVKDITAAVRQLCLDAAYYLPEDVERALRDFREAEPSPVGRDVLDVIIKNAEIARDEEVAICQDTGYAVAFVTLGQEVRITGGGLTEAIAEGVRRAYADGYLRKSIVEDPLRRKNTGDNTPPVIHYDVVPGDALKIHFEPKGGGCENMSRVAMLKPADGVEGVRRFVLRAVDEAGPNPCPPTIIGVGIGGDFEKSAILAKKATLRTVGSYNPDPYYAGLEKQWLEEINRLGVGPQGLGGRTTSLWLAIETYPCHIASLPAAVNVQCHAARHKSVEL